MFVVWMNTLGFRFFFPPMGFTGFCTRHVALADLPEALDILQVSQVSAAIEFLEDRVGAGK